MGAEIMFKCPSCGGYLEFDPTKQKFRCLYCGQLLTEAELQEESRERETEAEAKQEEMEAQGEAPVQESLRTYRCQMCGAEIVTDETTAATRCYYCHSPVVLHDRLDDEFRPDGVIPFQMDKNEAQQKFREYVSRKKFIDKSFFSDDQLEMFSGVYYPFWYCDFSGDASFEGEGKRSNVTTTSQYIVTTTRIYRVVRRGHIIVRNLARKALGKVDGKLADGIHPFDIGGVKPYASGYLSGFLAEKRDVEKSGAFDEMLAEARRYASQMMKSNHSYNSLSGNTNFIPSEHSTRHVLLPTWVLTYKGGEKGTPYYYMMNGQTGRVCGKLPIDWRKLLSVAFGAGAAVAGLLILGGMMLW